jgi:hypothetical protein
MLYTSSVTLSVATIWFQNYKNFFISDTPAAKKLVFVFSKFF